MISEGLVDVNDVEGMVQQNQKLRKLCRWVQGGGFAAGGGGGWVAKGDRLHERVACS